MIIPSSQRCPLFSLQMDAVEFVRTAPPLPPALMNLIEKVVRSVTIPFAFIVDMAINTVRIVANVFISLANCLHGPPLGTTSPPNNPTPENRAVVVNEVASEILASLPQVSSEVVVDDAPAPEVMVSPTHADSAPPPYSPPVQNVPVVSKETEADKQIGLLLTKLIELGGWDTIAVGFQLKKIGKTIRDVPPLEFLASAVNTAVRVKQLKDIFGNRIKKSSFLSYENDGPSLSQKLTTAASEPNFNDLLTEFTKQTGMGLDVARKHVGKWEDFVKALILAKSAPSVQKSQSSQS